MKSPDYIALDEKYGAHNYHPLPVVISWAEGCKVRDPEGKTYFDFLSAYSAVNQGHCHPRILKTLVEQAQKVFWSQIQQTLSGLASSTTNAMLSFADKR